MNKGREIRGMGSTFNMLCLGYGRSPTPIVPEVTRPCVKLLPIQYLQVIISNRLELPYYTTQYNAILNTRNMVIPQKPDFPTESSFGACDTLH